jgi:galactose oxidase
MARPEPSPAARSRRHAGPVGPKVAGSPVTVISGNQYRGAGGNPADQLRDGSTVLARKAGTAGWTAHQMEFLRAGADADGDGNNKYYGATLPLPEPGFAPGDMVEYYLRIPYADRDLTFVHADPATTTATTADEATARANPFSFTVAAAASFGRWGPLFALPNVAIHASLLPTGKVLMWGRRGAPDGSLDEHVTTPFIWDPAPANPTAEERETGRVIGVTDAPRDTQGATVNLFCAGHAFLPDGRLLVVGGHERDSIGIDQATIFDPYGVPGSDRGTWTAVAAMHSRRWYPTAMTLPDGDVLVVSGSFTADPDTGIAKVSEVWRNGAWIRLNPLPGGQAFELYPRLCVRSDGSVFMSGPLAQSWRLDLPAGGSWTPMASRDGERRDYAPSVPHARDQVLYIGGGTSRGNFTPTVEVEAIDLAAATRAWRNAKPLTVRRRQHNATILPDGSVLVTGGSRGGGGPGAPPGFNDLGFGQPVHAAERWDPTAQDWASLAAEQVDRCYHATAMLLPDARVLSAGGGEYRPVNGQDQPANAPIDSHRDGQIFSPLYLFRGPRPVITGAPASVEYGETFDVDTPDPTAVAKVTWIRLPSVTHSMDMSQRIDMLAHQVTAGTLRVTAPADPKLCPPGHHMLFLLTADGVPSRAAIVRVRAAAGVDYQIPTADPNAVIVADTTPPPVPGALRVVVGVTGTCPYGIGACWGGADEALRRLTGVQAVDPPRDAASSTVRVHLDHVGLPAVADWPAQFARSANGSYAWHGAEVELSGTVRMDGADPVLVSEALDESIRLVPLDADAKVQRDFAATAPQRATEEELAAFDALTEGAAVTITGPLAQRAGRYQLAPRLVTR